jgi:flagellar biosynthesis anti-sigma factor FlgM
MISFKPFSPGDPMQPLPSTPSPSASPSPTPKPLPTATDSKTKDERPGDIQQSESVSTSQAEQEIHHYREAIADLPDARQERISAIQRALRKGTYSVSTQDLADKLIQEISTQPPGEVSSSN